MKKSKAICAVALCFAAMAVPSSATLLYVPNGNFTNAGNAGEIGGTILGGSGSGAIGTNPGPWSGTYNAVLGLLLAPELTINTTGGEPSGGQAVISGIAEGLDVLDLVDSYGYFSDDLGVGYQPNTTYTLTANVDPGLTLALGVLSLDNAGVGIGLTNGGAALADTTNPLDFLSLTLLGGTDYQLQLQFTTGSIAPTGDIGITLFDHPSGVAQANLLGDVAFSNVTLDASTPEPSSLLLLGCGLGLIGVGRSRFRRSRQGAAK